MDEKLIKIYKFEDILRETHRRLEDELIAYQRRVLSLHTSYQDVIMQTRQDQLKMLMLQRVEALNEAMTNYNDMTALLN